MSREFKISTIRQADNAINTVNERLRDARRQINSRLEEVRREAGLQARQQAQEAAQRAKSEMLGQLNRSISGVNDRMDRMDAAQRRRLNEVANGLYDTISRVNASQSARLEQARRDLRDDLRSLEQRTSERIRQVNQHLSELEREVKVRFDDQQAQLNSHSRQIGNLSATVNEILAYLTDERQKRREAVKLARDMRQAAYGRMDIARFNPRKSQEIERRMEALQAHPDDEGTVARASEAILQIQLAEEEAMRNKILYDALHAEATGMLDKLLAEVHRNRELSIAYPDSPQDVVVIETDFWNRGAYGKLSARLEALQAELKEKPSAERIKEIMTAVAEDEVRLGDMAGKAARSAILSENRVGMTEDIITALVSQGWQIEQTPDGRDAVDYLGGEDRDHDWREGVFAVLTSMNGERISIVVRPDEDEVNNEILFHRNDERDITDLEYIRSLDRIKKQIAKSGFVLGPTVAPQDGGDEKVPEMADAVRMGRKGAAARINERARTHK